MLNKINNKIFHSYKNQTYITPYKLHPILIDFLTHTSSPGVMSYFNFILIK